MANKVQYPKFNVWTKATGASDKCVISAHGGSNSEEFEAPSGVRIFFYVNPGQAFVGRTGEVISTASTRDGKVPKSVLSGGKCLDYDLWKLQGYHSQTFGPLQFLRKFANSMKEGGLDVDESFDMVSGLVDSGAGVSGPGAPPPVGNVDIVTIRYRAMKSACKFSELVPVLVGLGYTEIHCAFCR